MYRYEMVTDNEPGRTLPSPPLLGSSHFSGLSLHEDQDLLVPLLPDLPVCSILCLIPLPLQT